MTHDEIAKLIDSYHDIARSVYNSEHISISPIKSVQICETGAFVEAQVWIPKEWLIGETDSTSTSSETGTTDKSDKNPDRD